MSANHYQILGVAPDADSGAIRSAYRGLMRVYHPDRNDHPEAGSRAREITAAFAVLGDPEKRAAYDAATFGMPIGDQPWLADAHRAPAPMRKVGMACIAVALALSVTLAVRPEWPPAAPSGRIPVNAPGLRAAHPEPDVEKPALMESAPSSAEQTADASEASAIQTVQAVAAPPPPAPAAVSGPPDEPVTPVAVAQIAPPALRDASAPLPIPAEETANAQSAPAPDGRRAEVERLASSFLKQSLEHADWTKQQLLLSARNRAATSRHLCRSDDCVSEAWLRQIRDTTTIMEGRIPAP
jgi:hypothetical protein